MKSAVGCSSRTQPRRMSSVRLRASAKNVPLIWYMRDGLEDRALSRRLLSLLSRRCDLAVCISRYVAAQFRQYISKTVPSMVIYNIVDLNRFQPGVLPPADLRKEADEDLVRHRRRHHATKRTGHFPRCRRERTSAASQCDFCHRRETTPTSPKPDHSTKNICASACRIPRCPRPGEVRRLPQRCAGHTFAGRHTGPAKSRTRRSGTLGPGSHGLRRSSNCREQMGAGGVN